MAYIGNTPAESYASFETETFTVSATANYTLSHAVTNENEIRLVINGVVQQPGSGKAYTASGTTLTLSSATVSGDVMYCVYLGRALQTVNPPNASVGNSQTAPTIITGQTAETSIATDDTILIHDTSASALRKMTRANFVSGIGGTNTPAFFAYLEDGTQSGIASSTFTKIQFNAELFDIGSGFNTSTNTYTIPEAGKYLFYFQVRKQNYRTDRNLLEIRLNGSGIRDLEHGSYSNYGAVTGSFVRQFSANDTIDAYLYQDSGSNQSIRGGTNAKDTWMYGFKIIE
nr:c1q globular head like domain containing protein [uncultured Mediterranean phage uvMED]